MNIVLGLYFALVWLVFSRLKPLPWNGFSKALISGGAISPLAEVLFWVTKQQNYI